MTRIRAKACELGQIFIVRFVRFDDHMNPGFMRITELLAVNAD